MDLPMTLRDYLAGQALIALSGKWPRELIDHDAARRAYMMADAMLAERAKAETPP